MISKSLKRTLLSLTITLLTGLSSVYAAPQVEISGDAQIGPLTAETDGSYQFVNVPLRRNSVNRFTVTARDGAQTQSREVVITQVSLDSVVVSKIKAEPLSVQEIEQLVNDGVIQLDDPANFHVSKFEIVLTIGRREVPISIPLVRAIEEPEVSEEIEPKSDPGSGNGNPPPPPPQIIVFEVHPPGPPGEPPPPPIPGVLIIEGRIKTLKEFYSVRLLLMNTSGIFTLRDVVADIEFPDGGLSHTLPSDGIVQFGDILPGDGETPGQKEREFIIRGDEIGIRGVKVNFGGTLIGPGIPEEDAIPFNGSAQTTVEVKGPPEFRVQVIHPPSVIEGIPYELLVDITNVGETPALYTSFELDVGADGELVECAYDEFISQPVCTPIEGSAVRNIGHLLPGQKTRQSFTINPFVTGDITSCMSISDQNIDLQVIVGAIGCLAGKRPAALGSADGIPTVSVLPIPNSFGLGIETPVTAFFNEVMNTSSITTGLNGTFNVFNDSGGLVPGQLRFVTIADHTVAIWQPSLGPLSGNTTYTVSLSQTISDLQGFTLNSAWISEFSTTDPNNDTTPPTLTLAIEPPVIPHNVIPGQIIELNAYPADQGSGVSRVELRIQDMDVPGASFTLIDQKTVFADVSEIILFAVDSGQLVPGHTYQFMATAFDRAGNSQDATIAAVIAPAAAAPVIELGGDPAQPVLQGVSVSVAPVTLSPSVKTVDYFLDSQTTPFKTVTLAPFSATHGTLNLDLGAHTIKAVATDSLGQTGEDTLNFTLIENPSEPVVNFGASVDGAQYIIGTPVSVNGEAIDPLGISSVAFYLDSPGGTPLTTSTEPFVINTESLAPGTHQIFFKAINKLGVSNDLNDPASILEFDVLPVPPPAPPPAAPIVTDISYSVNGQVNLKGASVAAARIDVANLTGGFQTSVFANSAGVFELLVAANDGDLIRLIALNLAASPSPSSPTDVVVPTAPVLDHITVNPSAKTFNAANQFQDIVVTGHYEGGDTADLTAQSTFSSSNASVASVNSAGRVAGLANGSAVITVTAGGKQAQVSITVEIVTLNSIAINPADFTIFGVSKTQQLVVMGTYSNGATSPIPAGNVAFASSSIGVVMINGNGLVTTISLGEAVITASVAGVPPAQALVKVEAVTPEGISVSPNAILFTAENETRQLDVTVDFNDGSTGAPAGPVDYNSDNPSVATVNEDGLVTAVANGDATISAQHEGFTATVTVVTDIPVSEAPPPEMTGLDRYTAGEGDTFSILGKNFAAVPGDNIVRINSLQAIVQSARQDELTVIVPEGAVGGPVTVEVAGKLSNSITIGIFGRRANTFQITPAVDIAAGAGTKLLLAGPVVDFRAEDKVYLSSAPDILAPLNYTGQLRVRLDGGSFFDVGPTGQVLDLTGSFTPGDHTVDLDLGESAGKHKTSAIYLVAGPNNTGAISGFRSIMANGQSRSQPVTFINLTDHAGNPYPDGAKVVVTAESHCFRSRPHNFCIGSHGGSIANGEGASPDGYGLKIFTVQNGRIDVIYDPGTAPALETRTGGTANIQVLPANAIGNRTSDMVLDFTSVSLTVFESVGTSRSQTSTVADGLEKIVTVVFSGARDSAGQPVPDGTPFLVTVESHCFRDPGNNSCIGSAGGALLSGDASSDGFGLRKHVLSDGKAEIQYSPGTIALSFPDTATANLQFLPSRPDSSRIGSRAFQVTPIQLSSLTSPELDFDATIFADGGDNRMIIRLSGFKDASGSPVPDGSKIAVTAQAHCFRDPVTNACIGSVGGVIKSGTPSPDGFGLYVHDIQGGEAEIVYSSEGVAMETRSSGEVAVQILPATPSGNRIGSRAFAVARFNAVGIQTSVVTATPSAVVADNNPKTVNILLTNIRDTSGNVVPDGAKVVLTPQAHCFRNPEDSSCIPSLGGVITSGTASPEGFGFRIHTVSGGQIQATYDPDTLTLAFPDVGTANIQVLPAQPSGNRIGNHAFSIVPVTLSSLQQTQVTINPASLLADQNTANVTTITLTGIKDGAGNNVPDGTKIVATPQAHCFRDPATNGCVSSAGGTVTSGTPGPEGFGFQVHTISGGSVQMTYASSPVLLESRQAAVANVQILPAQSNGNRVGNRAFALASVTLAGYQSADVSGPGQLAPNAVGTYVVSNIRDTSGNLVPNGSKIVVTPQAHCFRDPDTNGCVGSIGGVITNGVDAVEGFGFKVFTVAAGQISIDYQAPAGTGTAVLQLLPANSSGFRIGNRAFAVKSVSVQS